MLVEFTPHNKNANVRISFFFFYCGSNIWFKIFLNGDRTNGFRFQLFLPDWEWRDLMRMMWPRDKLEESMKKIHTTVALQTHIVAESEVSYIFNQNDGFYGTFWASWRAHSVALQDENLHRLIEAYLHQTASSPTGTLSHMWVKCLAALIIKEQRFVSWKCFFEMKREISKTQFREITADNSAALRVAAKCRVTLCMLGNAWWTFPASVVFWVCGWWSIIVFIRWRRWVT